MQASMATPPPCAQRAPGHELSPGPYLSMDNKTQAPLPYPPCLTPPCSSSSLLLLLVPAPLPPSSCSCCASSLLLLLLLLLSMPPPLLHPHSSSLPLLLPSPATPLQCHLSLPLVQPAITQQLLHHDLLLVQPEDSRRWPTTPLASLASLLLTPTLATSDGWLRGSPCCPLMRLGKRTRSFRSFRSFRSACSGLHLASSPDQVMSQLLCRGVKHAAALHQPPWLVVVAGEDDGG
ncbi:hypothetical protein V8C86DRAFT_2690598 [Haematococcus lacustris]